MSLTQTGLAVGSVSSFLVSLLSPALGGVSVTVQRPQANSSGTATSARLNLFLYEIEIDGAMRNISLTPGSQPPLWVVLRYLLTAFDEQGESDTIDSQNLLGQGMQVLLGVGDVFPPSAFYTALSDNPEPLKLTFDQATPELLSRLMQGPDDKYRCSAAFQVRPVLIAEPQPVTGLQLVGVNYVLGTEIGLAGVRNFVLPSLGPQLTDAQPWSVELGDTLTLLGNNLGASGISVHFGSATLTPNSQHSDSLSILISGLDPTVISAGNIAVSASQTLASGLSISSGAVSVALLPTVATISIVTIAAVSAADPDVYATVGLTGKLLGSKGDYVEFALVRNGAVAILLDSPDPAFTPPPDQTQQQFTFPVSDAIPPGTYFAVLRVNGQQAKQAFTLNMVAP